MTKLTTFESLVGSHFRESRIVAFSTGNVSPSMIEMTADWILRGGGGAPHGKSTHFEVADGKY